MKLVYVGFSFLHHGKHAGYDKIRYFLTYDKIIHSQKSFQLLRTFIDSKTFLSKIYAVFFGGRLWWVELRLIFMCLLNPNSFIFHIVYGENIYKYLHFFKRKNKIVLSLHQPMDFFKEKRNRNLLVRLRKVDKIIVMSNDVAIFLAGELKHVEIKFIPHGIDNNFFKPKGLKEERILMVGNWLRDFEFASNVFNRIKKENSNIKVCVVTNKINHSYFNPENVEIFSGIDDEYLLELYQKSKVVFLPLKEFTANNAVLEASLVGCKIVVATENIDQSYFKENQIQFIKMEESIAVDCLLNALFEENFREYERSTIKYASENFSWERIASITKEFLLYNF